MKTFTTEKGNWLLVPVPEDTVSFELYDKESLPTAIIVYTKHELFKPGIPSPIVIPPGNWSIIGNVWELAEDDWKNVVPQGHSSIEHRTKPDDATGFTKSIDAYGRNKWTKVTDVFYKDYLKKPHHRAMGWTAHVASATESGVSLMRSLGVEEPHILLKQVG